MTARKAGAPKGSASKTATPKTAAQKATAQMAAAPKAAVPKPAARKIPARSGKPAALKSPPQSLPYDQGKWAAAFHRKPGEVRYWLVKSELDVFSFDDLLAAPRKTTIWDGVRNTGARNFLRDGLKKGDLVFYYHSNASPSAIVGICEVVREGYPDPSAFDPADHYHDADSDPEHPMWFCVDLKAVKKLSRPVELPELKNASALREMALLRVGRLSVVPVTHSEWNAICDMSNEHTPA